MKFAAAANARAAGGSVLAERNVAAPEQPPPFQVVRILGHLRRKLSDERVLLLTLLKNLRALREHIRLPSTKLRVERKCDGYDGDRSDKRRMRPAPALLALTPQGHEQKGKCERRKRARTDPKPCHDTQSSSSGRRDLSFKILAKTSAPMSSNATGPPHSAQVFGSSAGR